MSKETVLLLALASTARSKVKAGLTNKGMSCFIEILNVTIEPEILKKKIKADRLKFQKYNYNCCSFMFHVTIF